MIATAEARRLSSLCPESRALAILDLRGDESPRLYDVFVRRWSPDGVIVRQISFKDSHLGDALQRSEVDSEILVVVVSEGGCVDRLWECLASAGLQRFSDGFRLVKASDDGSLCYVGELLEDGLPDRMPVRLTVTGKGTPFSADVRLPATIRAVLPQNGHGRAIEIDGKSSGEPMPSSQWYELVGIGEQELTVDLVPSCSGDRWQVAANGGSVRCRPLPDRPPACQLESLVLVFDRTCPSHNKWYDASRFLYDYDRFSPRYGERPEQDELDLASGQERTKPLVPAELNEEIRSGLGRAFGQASSDCEFGVYLFWFADVEGNGIVYPPGIDMPPAPFGCCGRVSNTCLAQALETLPYSPGLDLWDPLDEAILSAVTMMDEGSIEPQPILVVGNSPPTLPDRPRDNPFWSLLTGTVRTTVRQTSSRFLKAIETADRVGIPIAYLFLEGHEFDRADNREVLTYLEIQQQVKSALRHYFPVIEAEASSSGIANMLPVALELLARPSSVTVELKERK